jgi:fructokinase
MRKSFDAVCFGEILWDILPTGAKPGGAPMNVAYHLQKQGLQTALISRVGKDKWGNDLLSLLATNGVTTDYVQQDEKHITGIVNATVHESNEVTYEIVQSVAWDFISPEEGLTQLAQQANFFIYGSLSARNKTTANTLWGLVEAANTKVVDINLRPPHYTKALVEQLLESADILKLNENELPLISLWYATRKAEEEKMKFLQDRFGISTIIVTRGGDGAMVCQDGVVYSHPGYKVTVADTVGSGDAFLAGFLAKTKEDLPMGERLQFANSLGAFIASKQGACPDYRLDEIGAVKNASAI